MTKVELTLSELLELERMLNAGKEDFEVALSNIENLNLDIVYVKLLSKNILSLRRRDYLKHFDFDNLGSLSYESIYDDIAANEELIKDDTLKNYFISCISKFTSSSIDALGLPIQGIQVKVKWPKCKQ